MTGKTTGSVRLATTPQDYQRLGLDGDRIAPWEDGLRIGFEKGTYEWWYFDTHLKNGATLVVGFYTKPPIEMDGPLAPVITINLTTPDGRVFDKTLNVDPSQFSASKDRCDVRIGDNRFEGDLHTYRINAVIDDIAVDVVLTGELPSWRPRTGHTYFEHGGQERLFAWLPSVPQGRAEVRYSIGEDTFESVGSGYHDHNWGDAPMQELMHDWYWARAEIGPYTVIAAYITAEEKYGYTPQFSFVLGKDGVIVADDQTKVRFETAGVFTDEPTGKPVGATTRYIYQDGAAHYVISFERQETLLREKFADKLPFLKRIAAKAVGFDGAYLRFTGQATLERFEDGQVVERHTDKAIWELMYFGHPRPPAV